LANLLFSIAAVFALAGLVLAFIRLALGPTVADRAVGLDGMTIIAVSLITFIAYLTERVIYVDVALVYALISFLGVVALARYLERGIK